jgi:hypothetical protein
MYVLHYALRAYETHQGNRYYACYRRFKEKSDLQILYRISGHILTYNMPWIYNFLRIYLLVHHRIALGVGNFLLPRLALRIGILSC